MRAYVLAGRPDDQGDVAELVNLHSACVAYNSLPDPGGVLQQSARLMYLLNETRRAFAERELADQKRAQAEAKAASRR